MTATSLTKHPSMLKYSTMKLRQRLETTKMHRARNRAARAVEKAVHVDDDVEEGAAGLESKPITSKRNEARMREMNVNRAMTRRIARRKMLV
jgi:hypothetical protein